MCYDLCGEAGRPRPLFLLSEGYTLNGRWILVGGTV